MASVPKRYGLSSHLNYNAVNYKCVSGVCITAEPTESGTTLEKCMAAGTGCTHVDGGYVCEAYGSAFARGRQCLNGPKHKGTQPLSVCKSHCPSENVSNWIYCTYASPKDSAFCNYSVDIPSVYISTPMLGNGILAQSNGYGLEYILQPSKSYQSWVTLNSTISFNLTGVTAIEEAYVDFYFALSNRTIGGKTITVAPVGTDSIVSVAITYTVEMTEQPLMAAPEIRLDGWSPASKICVQIVSWTFNISDSVAPYPVVPSAPSNLPLPLRYGFNRELVRPYPYLNEGAALYLKFEDLQESYFEIEDKPVPFNKGSGVKIGSHLNPANDVAPSYGLLASPHLYSSWVTFNSTIFIDTIDPAPGDVVRGVIPVLFHFYIRTNTVEVIPGITFELIVQPDSIPSKPMDQQYPYTSHSISHTMQIPPDKHFAITPMIIFPDGIPRKFSVLTWTFSFMDSVNPTSIPTGPSYTDWQRYALQIDTVGDITAIPWKATPQEITMTLSMVPPFLLGKPTTVAGVTLPGTYPTLPDYTLIGNAFHALYEIWVTFRSDISFVLEDAPTATLRFSFVVDGAVVGDTFFSQVDSLPVGKSHAPRQAVQTLSITHSMWMTAKNVRVTPKIFAYHNIPGAPTYSLIITNWSFSIMDSVGPLRDPPSAYAHFSDLMLQGPGNGNGNGDDDSDSKWIWWALLAVVLIVVAFLLIMKRPWRSSSTTRTTADTPAGGFGNSHW